MDSYNHASFGQCDIGALIIRQGVSERLHWIPMDPKHRERIYRRSGEKAIRDYFNARGHLPYATDAEKARSTS